MVCFFSSCLLFYLPWYRAITSFCLIYGQRTSRRCLMLAPICRERTANGSLPQLKRLGPFSAQAVFLSPSQPAILRSLSLKTGLGGSRLGTSMLRSRGVPGVTQYTVNAGNLPYTVFGISPSPPFRFLLSPSHRFLLFPPRCREFVQSRYPAHTFLVYCGRRSIRFWTMLFLASSPSRAGL